LTAIAVGFKPLLQDLLFKHKIHQITELAVSQSSQRI